MVLAVNSDFDEGRVDPTTGYAIPDCDDVPNVDPETGGGNTLVGLNAVRDHLENGDIQNNRLTTEDLHKGWFGVNPQHLGDNFLDGATITIKKINKIDSDTGQPESGQVRFYAKWGNNNNQYYGITPYDLETLDTVNLVTGGVNGKPGEGVYGATSTIPNHAEFYMEGVRPGKITLEWRLQKGDIDIKHEQTFLVATQQSLADWREEVRYQIRLQSKVAGSEVDLNNYHEGDGFYSNNSSNVKFVLAIYYYYRQLFQQFPEEFMWAGMAKTAAAPIYAGMSDLTQWWLVSELHPKAGGVRDAGTEVFIEGLLLGGQKAIFGDKAWAHRAYAASGIYPLEHLEKVDPSITDFAAWSLLDTSINTGNQAGINSANASLLRREQEIVVQPHYNILNNNYLRQPSIPLVSWALGAVSVPTFEDTGLVHSGQWLTSNSNKNPLNPLSPHGPKFLDTVPNGRLYVFSDRWKWTSNSINGMLEMWIGTSSLGNNFNASKRLIHSNKSMTDSASLYSFDPAGLPTE